MPFPLHKAPRGLLELFRLRTLGEQPRLFSEIVQPVVDVTEFYGQDLKLPLSAAPTIGALPVTEDLVFTGPVRLHAIAAVLVVGAAAATNVTLECGIAFDVAGSRLRAPLQSIFLPSLAAGQRATVSTPTPAWVFQPGVIAYAFVAGTAAGADHQLDVRGIIDNITGAV